MMSTVYRDWIVACTKSSSDLLPASNPTLILIKEFDHRKGTFGTGNGVTENVVSDPNLDQNQRFNKKQVVNNGNL